MNDVLTKLGDLVNREIDKVVAKGSMSPSELEIAKKAVCLLKEIKECEALDTDNMHGYSERSYRRGRNPMTGQYESRGYVDYDQPYSTVYHDGTGYSGHSIKDRMISRLEGMMDEAKTDYERKTVEDFIHRLESGN